MSILDPVAPLRLALDEIEAAKCIGVSASTFRQLVRDGLVRRCKIYRCTRYLVSDLQAFLESSRQRVEVADDETVEPPADEVVESQCDRDQPRRNREVTK